MANHPPNLTNVVYQFAVETVTAVAETDDLYQADVQESDAEPIKGKRKMVRVGSYEASVLPKPDGTMKEFNGSPSVEFMVRPQSQSLADRVIAREVAHQMAMEFAAKIAVQPDLGGAGCHCEVANKSNGFRVLKSERYQISILNLVINRKDFRI